MKRISFEAKILSPLEEYADFGEDKNDMQTRLIGHAPHIAPKAYINVVYAPLNIVDLQEFCDRIERPVPIQFKEFLTFANGLMVFSGALRVMGYIPLKRKADAHIYNYPPNIIVPNVSSRVKGLPHGVLLVGFYKEDGSYVYLDEEEKAIRFNATGGGELIREWPDFDTWLSSEIAVFGKNYKLNLS